MVHTYLPAVCTKREDSSPKRGECAVSNHQNYHWLLSAELCQKGAGVVQLQFGNLTSNCFLIDPHSAVMFEISLIWLLFLKSNSS